MQLANKVEAAYRRGDLLDKRRSMMQDWSDFVIGNENKVLKLVGKDTQMTEHNIAANLPSAESRSSAMTNQIHQ